MNDATCFCGCGRRIKRLPLGRRQINKRGRLMTERYLYVADAAAPEDVPAPWAERGLELMFEIRDAMHGNADPRELDSDDSMEWLLQGHSLDLMVQEVGGPSINDWLAQVPQEEFSAARNKLFAESNAKRVR